ncbi:hypothetical protein SynBIOSE41_03439 [Synechococcus sp. BIOS-E4-1]|nr:hypothetical protein SynBIOSE41_03439 [Synechococcus sp. BIOS-E4-1]
MLITEQQTSRSKILTGEKERWTPINTPKSYKAISLNRARH